MPKYNSFEWNGYCIKPGPIGWRRLIHCRANIWDFPYFAGDYIKLRLTIEKRQAAALPARLTIYESLPEYVNEEEPFREKIIYGDMIGDIDYKKTKDIRIISRDSITITGDGYYKAELSMEELPDTDKPLPQIVQIYNFSQNIMTFRAHPSEQTAFAVYTMLWALIIIALSVIITACVTA